MIRSVFFKELLVFCGLLWQVLRDSCICEDLYTWNLQGFFEITVYVWCVPFNVMFQSVRVRMPMCCMKEGYAVSVYMPLILNIYGDSIGERFPPNPVFNAAELVGMCL